MAFFAALFWFALLCISSRRPVLEETADVLVWSVLKWRLSIIAMLIVVSPYRPDIGLLAVDDIDTRTCAWWIAVYLVINPLNVFLIWLVEWLKFGQEAVFGVVIALGVAVTVIKWR